MILPFKVVSSIQYAKKTNSVQVYCKRWIQMDQQYLKTGERIDQLYSRDVKIIQSNNVFVFT